MNLKTIIIQIQCFFLFLTFHYASASHLAGNDIEILPKFAVAADVTCDTLHTGLPLFEIISYSCDTALLRFNYPENIDLQSKVKVSYRSSVVSSTRYLGESDTLIQVFQRGPKPVRVCGSYTLQGNNINCCLDLNFLEQDCKAGAAFTATPVPWLGTCNNTPIRVKMSCSFNLGGEHKWILENGDVILSDTMPDPYFFSGLANRDGLLTITHEVSCSGDTVISQQMIPYPNVTIIGRPGDTIRLSDTLNSLLPGIRTVRDFILEYSRDTLYPLLLEGVIVFDEDIELEGRLLQMGENSKIILEGKRLVMRHTTIESAGRDSVYEPRPWLITCCRWQGIEAFGSVFIEWDSVLISDAWIMLNFPEKTTDSLPILRISNSIFHTNVFAFKSFGQPILFEVFSGNQIRGNYHAEAICDCQAQNAFDFRFLGLSEPRVSDHPQDITYGRFRLPKEGKVNFISYYEKAFHLLNTSAQIFNVDIFGLDDFPDYDCRGVCDWFNKTPEESETGLDFQFYLGIPALLELDNFNCTSEKPRIRIRSSGGGILHVKGKASKPLESIYLRGNKFGSAAIDMNVHGMPLIVDLEGINVEYSLHGLKLDHTAWNNSAQLTISKSRFWDSGRSDIKLSQLIPGSDAKDAIIDIDDNDFTSINTSLDIYRFRGAVIRNNNFKGDRKPIIHLLSAPNTVVKCNEFLRGSPGILSDRSPDSKVQSNYFNFSQPSLSFEGLNYLKNGSDIAWNTFLNNYENAIHFGKEAIVGTNLHSRFNEWINYGQNTVQVFHEGSDQTAALNQFNYPAGQNLRDPNYPTHNNRLLFLPTSEPEVPVDSSICKVRENIIDPANIDTFSLSEQLEIFCKVLADNGIIDTYSAPRRKEFEMELFNLVRVTDTWYETCPAIIEFFTDQIILGRSQWAAFHDSIQVALEEIERHEWNYWEEYHRISLAHAEIEQAYAEFENSPSRGPMARAEKVHSDLYYIDSLNRDILEERERQVFDERMLWSKLKLLNEDLPETDAYDHYSKFLNYIHFSLLLNDEISDRELEKLKKLSLADLDEFGDLVLRARRMIGEDEMYQQSELAETVNEGPSSIESEIVKPTYPVISLSPNPATDQVNIILRQTRNDEIERINLYNSSGYLVKTWHPLDQSLNESLYVGDLHPGAYYFEIYSGGLYYYDKLILVD